MSIQQIGALQMHAKKNLQRYVSPGKRTRRDAVQRIFRKKVQKTKRGVPSGSEVNLLPIPWLEKHPRKQITELALCH